MDGTRLSISKPDREALGCFFDNKEFKEDNPIFLTLESSWKSTTEIMKKLLESRKRTKQRLQKLNGFGLLEMQVIELENRTDYYWYISGIGLYYMLSTLERPQMLKFLHSNRDKMREFEPIKELLAQKKQEADYMISQIRNYVNERKYLEIAPFVVSWMTRVFGSAYSFDSYTPNFKETIKKNYDEKTILKLEKFVGRIIE